MKKAFKIELVLFLLTLVTLLLFAFTTDTTGDAGDSITHYLYSHYAFKYPQFFLHHWAKPVFVLLSSPFAQFGFKGMVVFNCICAALTALFTFYTARNLKLNNIWLVFIFIFFAPLYFKLIFSGLTEYLFALFLILGIYLITELKFSFALILISFLPLIRSEGLLIVGVFAVYCVLSKKYRLLPFLLTGQLIYTLIGALYYQDFLWVINKIPYASLVSPYGKGEWYDFIFRLNYVIEKPLFFLVTIGSLVLGYKFLRAGLKKTDPILVVLVAGSFVAVFVMHSIFWWLSVFNSMGLARVLIAVVPLVALISLAGLQTISNRIQNTKMRSTLISGIVLLVCFYPFTERPEGIVFNDKLFVVEENKLIANEVVPYIKKQFPNYSETRLYFSHPYLGLALDLDYFDPAHHQEMQHLITDDISKGTIIIWDDWYSLREGGIALSFFSDENRFELLQTFQKQIKDRKIEYAVLKAKTSQ